MGGGYGKCFGEVWAAAAWRADPFCVTVISLEVVNGRRFVLGSRLNPVFFRHTVLFLT